MEGYQGAHFGVVICASDPFTRNIAKEEESISQISEGKGNACCAGAFSRKCHPSGTEHHSIRWPQNYRLAEPFEIIQHVHPITHMDTLGLREWCTLWVHAKSE